MEAGNTQSPKAKIKQNECLLEQPARFQAYACIIFSEVLLWKVPSTALTVRPRPFLVLTEGDRNSDFEPLHVQMYSSSSLTKGISNIKWGYLQICPSLFLEHVVNTSDCTEKLSQSYFWLSESVGHCRLFAWIFLLRFHDLHLTLSTNFI